MNHLIFGERQSSYPIVILVNRIKRDDIHKAYIEPFGLDEESVLVLDLYQLAGKKKLPMSERRAYLEQEIIPTLESFQTQYVLCADAEYYKALMFEPKAEANLGYVKQLPNKEIFGLFVPNYEQIFYKPDEVKAKIAQSFDALYNHISGTYVNPGADIVLESHYPSTVKEIGYWLTKLLNMDVSLTCDIEAFSLKHYNAGIGTIAFSWAKGRGVAFPVDLLTRKKDRRKVRKMLAAFFVRLKKSIIFHNISYDVTVLIYQLYMSDLLDQKGLLRGLDIMLKNWHDTKLISYLATNSCAGNKLGLKEQAQEYAGNYAVEEIKDIRAIPLKDLLRYNLVDCFSTWHVYEKHWDTLVADQQLDIYETIFKPAIKDIIQMQLTGAPLNMKQVLKVEADLTADMLDAMQRMLAQPIVQALVYELNNAWVIKRNSELKVKRVTIADAKEEFNPNSGAQLIKLLYEIMQLPVLGQTDSGLPETGGDTLKALKNHTKNEEYLAFLDALIDFKAVNKILTSFIPAFKEAQKGPDGWHYLFGNFNLGGTVSGRLSSSNPNLQNMPATKSKYAKPIKSCFSAPPGWLFCGIDFNSLEDRISALTTKDPNKLKVYMGHIVYAVDIDGVTHHIRDDDTIVYDGVEYSGQAFYEAFGKVRKSLSDTP